MTEHYCTNTSTLTKITLSCVLISIFVSILHGEEKSSALQDVQKPWVSLGDELYASVSYPLLYKNSYLITAYAHLRLTSRPLILCKLFNKGSSPLVGIICKTWVPGFSEEASSTLSIKPGENVSIPLYPAFSKELGTLVEQRPANLIYEICNQTGKVYCRESKPIILTSRNDLFIHSKWLPFLGVCVTPNERLIDQLISIAADKLPSRSFAGYQKGENHVLEQIMAIYITLSELGLHYRSATSSFLKMEGGTFQKVYFPAESLEGKGANCVDGSCLFASAFEKLGLETYLVIMPHHAMVAVDLAKGEKKNIRYLETTLLGKESFIKALEAGKARVNKNRDKTKLISISRLRKSGIKPFPFPVSAQDTKLILPTEKIFEIRPIKCDLSSSEFENEKLDGAPEIYLVIYKNSEKILDTKSAIVQDSFSVSWEETSLKCRFNMTRADTIKLKLYDKDVSKDDSICTFNLQWIHFVARTADVLKTSAGSTITLEVREIK